MNKFKTVLHFEYMGYINGKTFRVVTILLVLLIAAGGFLPQISEGISGLISDDDGGGSANASYIFSDEMIDNGTAEFINADIMDQAVSDYKWKEEKGEAEKVAHDYSVTIYFKSLLEYDLYASGQDMGSAYTSESLDPVLKSIAQQVDINGLPADVQGEVSDILNLTPKSNVIQVDGDAMQNYWLGYVLIFLLYMVIIMYGQFVVTSVVTEKSTKAMELLITSADSNSLMFGKVVGVGLAALTQLIVIFGAAALVIFFNKDAWQEFMPMIFGILESSPLSFKLILYFILFFIMGYFLYAFMYAALGSTVSRMEDASSVVTLPMILVIIAFFVSIVGLMNIDSFFVKVCSYIPFFSPMLMFSRLCMGDADNLEVIISLAILLATILLIGWLAAKIYRMGVLMYGQKMGLANIIKAAVKNR